MLCVVWSNFEIGGVDVDEILLFVDEGMVLLSVIYVLNIFGVKFDIVIIVECVWVKKLGLFIVVDVV